jgi:hypothetical protein
MEEFPPASAADAARLLAEWCTELGYLQHADAAQLLVDAFGDRFVVSSACGQRCIRCDVLAAWQALAPAAVWVEQVACAKS